MEAIKKLELNESIIEVNQLDKSFVVGNEEVKVLKNINMTVEAGEFVSIMGPSGSGKSTLLYLLGGLDQPTSGSIRISGKELSIMKDKQQSIMRRRNIGFVFQFYNLIPNLNVEENIMLPLLLDGKKQMEYKDQLNEVLDLVGLTEKKKYTPNQLSGGQQQRVAIARAVIGNPDVILADEPIGSLDTKTGMEIMNLLKKINIEKRTTIVQVTHSPEAAQFGHRVIYMRDGIIEQL